MEQEPDWIKTDEQFTESGGDGGLEPVDRVDPEQATADGVNSNDSKSAEGQPVELSAGTAGNPEASSVSPQPPLPPGLIALDAIYPQMDHIYRDQDSVALTNLRRLLGEPLTVEVCSSAPGIPFDWTIAEYPGTDGEPLFLRLHSRNAPVDPLAAAAAKTGALVVSCGLGGLAAVRFRNQRRLDEFLIANDNLKKASISYAMGNYFVWIRVQGPRLKSNVQYPHCKLWAEDYVTVYVYENRSQCGILKMGSTPEVLLEEIDWLDHEAVNLRDRERQISYGPPFINERPNLMYFARRFVQEHGIVYDCNVEQFYNEKHSVFMDESEVYRRLTRFLDKMTIIFPNQSAGALFRSSSFRDLFATIKNMGRTVVPIAYQSFEYFVWRTYEIQEGSSVTVTEILDAFHDKHPDSDIPRGALARDVRKIVRKLFRLSPSNSILRDDRQQNGFRNLGRRVLWGGSIAPPPEASAPESPTDNQANNEEKK